MWWGDFSRVGLHKDVIRLRRVNGQIITLEHRKKQMRGNERRQDTREKIQLGGLVVKAGLRRTDKAVILGILKEAASKLSDKSEFERFRIIGKAAFRHDDETGNDGIEPDHADAADGAGADRS